MANLQVKNLPEEMHEALRKQARAQHTTISRLVIDAIRDKIDVQEMDNWLDEVRALPRHDDIDVLATLDEVRDEIEGY